MLKGGIYLDVENLCRNGGWRMSFSKVRELAQAQGITILRANAYIAINSVWEGKNPQAAQKSQQHRDAIRQAGFHLVTKEVKRFKGDEGFVYKANSDLDLAVDALIQSENLDYVLLGSGDGDFVRLVRALQNRGRRVDVFAFDNVSHELRIEADTFFSGFLLPGMVDCSQGRYRGLIHAFDDNRGFGFITTMDGYRADQLKTDLFFHVSDFAPNLDNEKIVELKNYRNVVEFSIFKQDDGRTKAIDIREFEWMNT